MGVIKRDTMSLDYGSYGVYRGYLGIVENHGNWKIMETIIMGYIGV